MTEAKLTTDHTSRLRTAHPTWVVLKHCDRFTSAIPDISVSLGTKTVWVEYKLLKKDERLDVPKTWVNDLAQLELTRRLGGYYLAYDPREKQHLLVAAAVLQQTNIKYSDFLVSAGPGSGLDYLESLLVRLLEEDTR